MKKLILISSVALFFIGSQLCGFDNCSQVNAQTLETVLTKNESKTVTLKITGMTCAGCANHVSKALEKVDGILEEEVKFPGDIAIIKYDSDKTNEKDIIAAIEKTGYMAEVIKESGEASIEEGKKAFQK